MQQWLRTPFQIWKDDFTPLKFKKYIYLFCVCSYGDQRTACRSQSSLPSMWPAKTGTGYQSWQETAVLLMPSLKPSHALLHTSIPHLFCVSYNSSYRKKIILIDQVSHYVLWVFFSLWLSTLLLSVSTSTACLKENPWELTVILWRRKS